MRRMFFLLAAAMVSMVTMAQNVDDPVVMVINGKPVVKSEFAYSYAKNNGPEVIDHKSVAEYVDLFVNYKLKVEAALDAKCDTLSSYDQEFRKYRDKQILPTMINEDDVEAEAHRLYDAEAKRVGPDGLICPQHILFFVGQNPTDSLLNAKKAQADSVYQVLKNGADFSAMAKQISDDHESAENGGVIGWICRGTTVKNFEDAAFALQKGELSKPVLTEYGYHIIKMANRGPMPTYDSLSNDIHRFIEMRGIRMRIAKNRVKDIAASKGTTENKVMDERADSISNVSQEMKYLIREYHDGLLLYEVSNREVWEKAANDEEGLKAFYKKNKKKYVWEEPRFKGIAYYTKDAADIAAVKKAVKGKNFDDWAQILRTTFNNDSVLRIRVEKGIFKKGDNALVDVEVFGGTDKKQRKYSNFPHTAVFGKKMKSPEEMSDVRNLVVADYQEQKEKEWVKALREKYPVEVNWDVVNTVK